MPYGWINIFAGLCVEYYNIGRDVFFLFFILLRMEVAGGSRYAWLLIGANSHSVVW